MKDETRAWLFDVKNAIEEINTFLPEKKEFQGFKKDIKTKRAIERNFEIIGEAINRILQSGEQLSITNAKKIVATRNRIIHGYDTVSDEIIWAIIVKDLPLLYKEISSLLD